MSGNSDDLHLAVHDTFVGAVTPLLAIKLEAMCDQDFDKFVERYVGHRSGVVTKSCRA